MVKTARKTLSDALKAAWKSAKGIMETVKKLHTQTFEDWKADQLYLMSGMGEFTVADFHQDMKMMPIEIVEITNEKVTFYAKSK